MGIRDKPIAAGSPWQADLPTMVLVDATNPLLADLSGLALGHSTSAGEQVARWARTARVVKCFNTLGAQNFASPEFAGQSATMFFCGDDQEAKEDVLRLGEELGFDMVDAGPLTQARLLEPLPAA